MASFSNEKQKGLLTQTHIGTKKKCTIAIWSDDTINTIKWEIGQAWK